MDKGTHTPPIHTRPAATTARSKKFRRRFVLAIVAEQRRATLQTKRGFINDRWVLSQLFTITRLGIRTMIQCPTGLVLISAATCFVPRPRGGVLLVSVSFWAVHRPSRLATIHLDHCHDPLVVHRYESLVFMNSLSFTRLIPVLLDRSPRRTSVCGRPIGA